MASSNERREPITQSTDLGCGASCIAEGQNEVTPVHTHERQNSHYITLNPHRIQGRVTDWLPEVFDEQVPANRGGIPSEVVEPRRERRSTKPIYME